MVHNGESPGAKQFEHTPHEAPEWLQVHNAADLAEGGMMTIHEGNEPLVLCKLGNQFYAYYDRCPGCNMPLHLGSLEGGTLTCQLAHRYDIRHAGRGVDGNCLHLEPLPLLAQNGAVKVALSPTRRNEVAIAHEA
jgi:nitrite reductase/ring-hydroxylating ferredoxin subunit